MINYWMLEVREEEGKSRAVIGKQPDFEKISSSGYPNWLSGNKLNLNLSSPLVFQLDDRGKDLTDFFPPAAPLMSRVMLNALKKAGVEDIETYPVTLLDASGNEIEEEFYAINILDRVSCADLEASDCIVDDPNDPVGVDFNSLAIDEARAEGHLFFRLHEAPNGVVVHDSVRRVLEPLKLRGIVFVDPADWIG